MLSYANARKVVELAMEAGSTPILIGEAGIGKTTMMYTIGKEKDMEVFLIEGTLLKEGELGGLPTVVEYTDQDLDRIMKMQGKEEIKDISEILDTNLEYNKLMMKLELYKDDEEKIEKLMEEIIAYRTKAKKVMKAKNLKYLQEKEELRNSLPKTRTTYATFHTLAKLAERAAMYPDKKFIIFIDEINRSEHAVMQELMNCARRFHITILG